MEQLTQEDRIAGHRSFAFDAHIEDMYPVLTLGGSFHIMPSAIRHDLHAIREFLYEHRITGGGYATAVATLLLNTFNDLPMRFITAGGEKLEGVHSEHIEIINVYTYILGIGWVKGMLCINKTCYAASLLYFCNYM